MPEHWRGDKSIKDEVFDVSDLKSKFPHLFDYVDKDRGQLMSRRDAAKKAKISEDTIDTYIKRGYLESFRGKKKTVFVYYRDLLRASHKAGGDGTRRRMPGK